MPQVSVALSTYDGARWLREQLDSVLAQRDVDLEVVAVDDGSRDDTPAILEAYAARDRRLRWSRNPRNLGPTRSFERAIALCAGEFVAPCDQDDAWLPHKLRRLVDSIGDADLVYADSAYMDAGGRDCGRRVSDDTRMLEGQDPLVFLFANSVSGHAALVRRDCALRAMPYPTAGYHDWWLALSAAGGRGVRYVDEVLVRYRRHDGAYCGMGGMRARRDDWLTIRRALVDAYARRGERGQDEVAVLASAMEAAAAGEGFAPLARVLWRHRGSWPSKTGIPALDAMALALRLHRKLRRGMRAPVRATG